MSLSTADNADAARIRINNVRGTSMSRFVCWHLIIASMLPLAVATRVAASEPASLEILIEAEAFDHYGGWVLDQQFMDQMGSPYLLAHGLGVPVKDATTKIRAAAGGHVPRVRADQRLGRDVERQRLARPISSPRQRQAAGDDLWDRRGQWHWQPGGTIDVAGAEITLALHDLTGFEGRCDAIVFSQSPESPPNAGPEMDAFRRRLLSIPEKPADGGNYDLVVVGGGIAGMCTAMSAARLGATVALIQDRPVLGGNNSSEIRVWLNGDTNFEPYPHVGDLVREFEQRRRQGDRPCRRTTMTSRGLPPSARRRTSACCSTSGSTRSRRQGGADRGGRFAEHPDGSADPHRRPLVRRLHGRRQAWVSWPRPIMK